MQLTDEEEVALDDYLLWTASPDNLLVRRPVAQVDDLTRRDPQRQVAPEVHIAEDELVRGCVEDAQRAAEIIEGRRFGRIGHHREVAEGLAGVADGYPIDALWQAMARLRLVQDGARIMARDDPPAAGDLDVRRQATHRHGTD